MEIYLRNISKYIFFFKSSNAFKTLLILDTKFILLLKCLEIRGRLSENRKDIDLIKKMPDIGYIGTSQ